MLVEAIVPSGSLEPAVEAVTLAGAAAEAGVTDKAAMGGLFPPDVTTTLVDFVAVAPRLSVIVAVTV